ncbi:MAG: type II toxin-antitoxin system HicA family toxin [Acidimicrobiia bacterium]|nr:type II toxin-antitoxin system HicA family toxin [Acidimicrobiia bacterium]
MTRLRAIATSADLVLDFVREGANHEIWRIGNERIVIPRHREVNERTADGILRRAREVAADDK